MSGPEPAAAQEQRTGSVMAFPVSAVHFPAFIPAALPAVRRLLSGERHSGVFCAGAFISRRGGRRLRGRGGLFEDAADLRREFLNYGYI